MTLGSFPCPESASESAHGSAAPKGNIILHGAREAWSQPTISRPTHPAARPQVAASRSPCRGALSTPAGTPSPEGITLHHNGQCAHGFGAITVHHHTPSTVKKRQAAHRLHPAPHTAFQITSHLLQLQHNHTRDTPLQTIQRSQVTSSSSNTASDHPVTVGRPRSSRLRIRSESRPPNHVPSSADYWL